MQADLTPDEGWIEWAGGECPVAPETKTERLYRCGLVGDRNDVAATSWHWTHDGSGGDIIAYRVVSK